MANSREIKIIEKEFLENKRITKFVLKGGKVLNEVSKEIKTFFNLNFYEKEIKNEFFLELDKDSNLELLGNAILYLVIKEDINLELGFLSNEFSNLSIKILVKENKKLNLIDFSNSKKLYKNIEIVLEKNSQLNNSQFILNSIVNQTQVILFEDSKYNLKSVYFGDNIKNYITNIAIHKENNSKSDLQINGLAKENSKIINDSKIIIEKFAQKSIGHQKMKNLILDEKSNIQSEPILEVKNNDVICSHSSSISQVSDRVLFYINSRGISKSDAINLISSSYFNEVIESILENNLKEKYQILIEEFN